MHFVLSCSYYSLSFVPCCVWEDWEKAASVDAALAGRRAGVWQTALLFCFQDTGSFSPNFRFVRLFFFFDRQVIFLED